MRDASRFHLSAWLVVSLMVLLGQPVPAAAQEPFFKDKVVRIVVGFSAGGGFDTYSRVIGRHLGRHLPGRPAVIVENMPGAGSLIAANHVYKIAKPDGLTVGSIHGNQVVAQLVGRPGIEFDARKFEWIGVPVQDTPACALTKASGITSLERWMQAKAPVKLGATGPGDASYLSARVLQAALGLPIHLVRGYKGTAEIRLAAEAGEIAGACWQWESIKATWRRGLDAGDIVVPLQSSARPHPDLPGVPVANTVARTEDARQLIRAGIEVPATMTRPYLLPPGTPKDRVEVLRRAFLATLKDPDFLADASRSKLDVDPIPGEALEQMVAAVFTLPPPLVARLRELFGP